MWGDAGRCGEVRGDRRLAEDLVGHREGLLQRHALRHDVEQLVVGHHDQDVDVLRQVINRLQRLARGGRGRRVVKVRGEGGAGGDWGEGGSNTVNTHNGVDRDRTGIVSAPFLSTKFYSMV